MLKKRKCDGTKKVKSRKCGVGHFRTLALGVSSLVAHLGSARVCPHVWPEPWSEMADFIAGRPPHVRVADAQPHLYYHCPSVSSALARRACKGHSISYGHFGRVGHNGVSLTYRHATCGQSLRRSRQDSSALGNYVPISVHVSCLVRMDSGTPIWERLPIQFDGADFKFHGLVEVTASASHIVSHLYRSNLCGCGMGRVEQRCTMQQTLVNMIFFIRYPRNWIVLLLVW
jgi:hypothetical protein